MFLIAVAQKHSIISPNAINGAVPLSAYIEFVKLVESIEAGIYGNVHWLLYSDYLLSTNWRQIRPR